MKKKFYYDYGGGAVFEFEADQRIFIKFVSPNSQQIDDIRKAQKRNKLGILPPKEFKLHPKIRTIHRYFPNTLV